MIIRLSGKLFKFCVIVAVLLLLLSTVGLYFINDIIENQHENIELQLSDATGARASFERLTLGLFPYPSIELAGFRLLHKRSQKLLLSSRLARVNSLLLPLFDGDLVLTSITLLEPSINLAASDFAPSRSSSKKKKEVATEETKSDEEEDYSVSLKDISLQNASIKYESPEFSIAIDRANVRLKGVPTEETHSKEALITLSSLKEPFGADIEMSLEDVAVQYAGDTYGATTLNGPILLESSPDTGIRFEGALDVSSFSYGFPGFSIDRVNAKLKNIRGSIDAKSNVDVRVDVDGKSILLEEDSVRVTEIAGVTAPLRIEVPDSGGYSVSGPVTVTGGQVDLLDMWKLTDISGTVNMLVSAPLIDIHGTGIELESESEKKVLNTRYRLTAEEHIIDRTSLSFARGGAVEATTRIARDSGKVEGDVVAKEIRLAELAAFLAPGTTMEDTRKLEQVDAAFESTMNRFLDSLTAIGAIRFLREDCGKGMFVRNIFAAVTSVPPFNLLTEQDMKEKDCPGGVEFRIAERALLIERARMELARSNLEASGTVDLEKNIRLNARMVMARDTAASLGLGLAKLGKLFGALAKITVPLDLRGKLPDPEVSLDQSDLITESAATSLVTAPLGLINDAGKAVGRTFTGKEKKQKKPIVSKRQKRFQLWDANGSSITAAQDSSAQ